MSETEALLARMDAVVNEFYDHTRWFHEPLTVSRARLFVLQHRLNTRQRNSVLKVRAASRIPDWSLRVALLDAATQEIIKDEEYGGGKPHWQILQELGNRIGLTDAEMENAQPLRTTRLAWLAYEGLMSNRHWLEGLIGATVAERSNIPGYGPSPYRELGWFGVELQRWQELFGLSREELTFFDLHGEADEEHSSLGWNGVARYAAKLNMVDDALQAVRDTFDIWTLYLDGIGAAADALDRAEAGRAASAR